MPLPLPRLSDWYACNNCTLGQESSASIQRARIRTIHIPPHSGSPFRRRRWLTAFTCVGERAPWKGCRREKTTPASACGRLPVAWLEGKSPRDVFFSAAAAAACRGGRRERGILPTGPPLISQTSLLSYLAVVKKRQGLGSSGPVFPPPHFAAPCMCIAAGVVCSPTVHPPSTATDCLFCSSHGQMGKRTNGATLAKKKQPNQTKRVFVVSYSLRPARQKMPLSPKFRNSLDAHLRSKEKPPRSA